jgi:hypothetical protein
MAIKVSAKTVAQLRKGTMAGNLAKAKNASPEMREALNRFYGTKRVNAAAGPMKAPTQATKATPETAKKKPVVPAQAKRAGVSDVSKAKKYPSRPGGTNATTTTKKTTGQTKVNKPLIDVPKKLGGASAALKTKGAANAALYAKQQKAAQDKKKKGMK